MTHLPLIIFGAGGHAKVVADVARACGHNVLGFVDSTHPARSGEAFGGAVIYGSIAEAQQSGATCAALGFGQNDARLRLAEQLIQENWHLPVLIHPSAIVSSSAILGPGTVVMAMAVVQAESLAGNACIINTGAILEHDCRLESGVHLAPRSCLCGNVTVGRASFVGAGTVVREKLSIGSAVTVGCGSAVVSSLPDGCTAYGVPARIQAK